MYNRIIILPIAIAISAAFIGAAATPALASDASLCQTAPAQLRQLAATADRSQQRKALSMVSIGEKLCEAGGRNEASKKFAAAAKALGTDVTALNATVTAQSAQ